jgi:Ca2+-binding RTX toxin-like protein
MRRNCAYVTATLAALGLALPAAAGAAQVTTNGAFGVALDAAPGEANRVSAQSTPEAVTIRDDGANLTVASGSGCTLVDPHQVRCAPSRFQFTALLGDGNDTVALDGPFSSDLRGEEGDDQINGGSSHDNVDAGDGDDTIAAGAGDDEIRGGRGSDTIGGGAGTDLAAYDDPVPVTATLDGLRNDGAPGENDLIGPDVEGVLGGPGDDTLTGNDGPNRLNGGTGRDRISGAGGNDELTDGSGGNTFDGGAGDDTINSRGIFESDESGFVGILPGRDAVACGDGADAVIGDILDRTSKDCERVDIGIWLPDRRLSATRSARVATRVRCGAFTTCRFRVRLRQGGFITPLTSGRVPSGATRTVRMRLNSTGIRLLRKRRRMRVDVIVYGTRMPGIVKTVTLTTGTLGRG